MADIIDNTYIANKLKELANYYLDLNENYRAQTFNYAASLVSKFPVPITDPYTQLKGVPKIGPGTLKRIYEIVTTGQLEEIQNQPPPEINQYDVIKQELSTVHGIGPATAENFIQQGVTGLNDLITKYNEGKIKLTQNQVIGLTYYNDFQQRIPREEVALVGESIIGILKQLDPLNLGEIVGSYRRGKSFSGDIDILITHPENKNYLQILVNYLVENGLILHVLSLGPVKFQGVYNSGYPDNNGVMRKIDIRFIPHSSYFTGILHGTGSGEHNVLLRQRALEKNMTLSEHGLYNLDPKTKQRLDQIPVNSEEEIFNILGLEYVPPEQRDL